MPMPTSMATSIVVGNWVFKLPKTMTVKEVFQKMEEKFPHYWEANGDPYMADYIHNNFQKN